MLILTGDGGGTDDYWSTPENWVGDAVPTAPISDARIENGNCVIESGSDISMLYHVYLGGSDKASGNATLTVNDSTLYSNAGYGIIGYNPSDTGALYVNNSTVSFNGGLGMGVGWAGKGIVEINGGMINADRLYTSFKATCPGGSSIMINSGGLLNISGWARLANFDAEPASGTLADSLTINGGSMTVAETLDIGYFGEASLSMSGGGSLNVTGDLTLGEKSTATGTIDMSGGTISCANLVLGVAGEASISLIEGTIIADSLTMNAEGVLDIAGGTLILDGEITDITTYGNVLAYSETGLFNYNYDSIDNVTSITAVPEPITVMLLGLGGLLMRRRSC